MNMEAKESHNLPLASCRCRKASGRNSSLTPRRPENQARQWVREDPCLTPNRQRERVQLPLPLCSFLSLSRLDAVHTLWAGQPAPLSPPIPVLISPGDTLADTPRNNVSSDFWASHGTVKLTYKLNHHTGVLQLTFIRPQIFTQRLLWQMIKILR